ncbi:hypothetical protein B7P43_G08629 [Cryptotermes secundus]|uniref:Uncharacterized protein n=1 Tax=Cryptotermes secundus TaxID=105785 RepID=A0A2J7Q630_9NEOP|nr:hypothetical protein B7P43_G08629 [Cryptotermes secundus]
MVACSQLQKLRTNLLDIKQELVPSGADSGSDGGEEPVSRSEVGFCRMQMQLNECVRHHQAILQYVITFTVHVSSLQEVVKVEALRRADHTPKDSYRMCKVSKNRSERRSSWRYMRAMEDTLNIPFCGLFLMLLATLCFSSFSAVAVKYLFLTTQ